MADALPAILTHSLRADETVLSVYEEHNDEEGDLGNDLPDYLCLAVTDHRLFEIERDEDGSFVSSTSLRGDHVRGTELDIQNDYEDTRRDEGVPVAVVGVFGIVAALASDMMFGGLLFGVGIACVGVAIALVYFLKETNPGAIQVTVKTSDDDHTVVVPRDREDFATEVSRVATLGPLKNEIEEERTEISRTARRQS